jgi:alkanesulfonate monooxygenase SsuD/methylene tetrahydromethanopterin reductase-like flavin-dependent oxidoreductase (luciferase family)
MLGPDRRFHMGTGRGTSKLEFDAFEIDRNTTRARYAETLEVLRLALSQERFSHKGEYYEFGDVTVRPRPSSTRVLDDMLMAWGSAESLPIAANAGLKPLFIPQKGWAEMAGEMRQFNELRAEHGWAPARATAAIWTYVAPTRAEAEEQGGQYALEYADSTRLHYLIDKPEVFENTTGYERYGERAKAIAEAVKNGEDPAAATLRTMTSVQIIGSPEDCKDQLMDICQSLGVEHFVGVFQFGAMPREHAERSIHLFAEQVAPALKQLDLAAV